MVGWKRLVWGGEIVGWEFEAVLRGGGYDGGDRVGWVAGGDISGGGCVGGGLGEGGRGYLFVREEGRMSAKNLSLRNWKEVGGKGRGTA